MSRDEFWGTFWRIFAAALVFAVIKSEYSGTQTLTTLDHILDAIQVVLGIAIVVLGPGWMRNLTR